MPILRHHHAATVRSLFFLFLILPLCTYIYTIQLPSPAPPRLPLLYKTRPCRHVYKTSSYSSRRIYIHPFIHRSFLNQAIFSPLFFLPFLLTCVPFRLSNRLVELLSTQSLPVSHAFPFLSRHTLPCSLPHSLSPFYCLDDIFTLTAPTLDTICRQMKGKVLFWFENWKDAAKLPRTFILPPNPCHLILAPRYSILIILALQWPLGCRMIGAP